MKFASAALALSLTAAAAAAQTASPPPQFTDPANLRGERVRPRDGRELPIDGGLGPDGQPNTTLALQQLLRRLNTRASILNIVAHPDDEDGGMLTYYSRGLGARVADLSLTRGEGGQNAMTSDFDDALGLLRTQELLANDRYTGVDQMFGTEVDFGFSKTKSEAFAKWTHDRVLYDAVRAVRLYRPLVITSTWIGNVTDGHGQHQVAGQIAQEAFAKAGDPTVFPDQIAEGILPWQPLRVYARVPTQSISEKGLFDYATGQYVAPTFTNYVTGEVTHTTPTTDVIVHEGQPDPLLTTAAANPADLKELAADNIKLVADISQLAAGSSKPVAATPLTYVQFARIGLGLQRSQIPAGFRPPPTGTYDVPYHLYGSCPTTDFRTCHPERSKGPASTGIATTLHGKATPADPNFFTSIDTSIEGIATLTPSAAENSVIVIKTNLAGIQHSIEEAQLDLKPEHPEFTANRLAEALKLTEAAKDNVKRFTESDLPAIEKANILYDLRTKQVQLNDALAMALGSTLNANAEGWDLVQNQTASVALVLNPGMGSHMAAPVYIKGPGNTSVTDSKLRESKGPNKSVSISLNLIPLSDTLASVTLPYFHRENIEQPIYELTDQSLRNAPHTPHPITAWSTIRYKDVTFEVGHVVSAKLQPISVVPILSVSVKPDVAMIAIRNDVQPATLAATAVTNLPTVKPDIELLIPETWKGIRAPQNRTTAQPSDELTIHTSILATGINRIGAKPVTIRFFAVDPLSRKFTETSLGYRPVGYAPLPRTNFYTLAETRFVPVDLTLPTKHRIAYLPGTGDAVPQALASIGLAPTILTVADLTPSKLAAFDTVILGVRTYAAHPDLHGAPTQALLDYAHSGGNVLLQYQTAEFTAADAPYPLTLGRDAEKVVDETAPVQLLLPAQPGTAPGGIAKTTRSATPIMEYALLNTPNVITPADFNGWVAERGHGFLRTWDAHYAALTETHDPGSKEEGVLPQDPQRGGLITTPLGKGRWTYCAFAIYRQLPEAVPGAYRLFLNLISP